MKSSFILLVAQLTFIGVLLASNGNGQSISKINVILKGQSTSLRNALKEIEKQSNLKFIYGQEIDKYSTLKIDFPEKPISVQRALEVLLKNTNLKYSLLASHVIIETRPVMPQSGKISGKVLDDKGETLPGASVRIVESGSNTQTSADGSYTINLKPGTYTLEVSYISFQTQRITSVEVSEGKNTPLDIAMKPNTKGLKEVVVTSGYKRASVAGLYARQKNNAAMSDGITAEQISRTPDNNTAQVLRRVSGLQVSQNKYVVVRGLSDRYNNVLLNGNQLPSTEPNRRDFAFDMIPSSLVDNIVVNKTATPDLPGEFTGGLVQITTKDIPDENFIILSIGTGFNNRSTGKDFIGGQRSSSNYLGFANNNQKKPEGMTFRQYNVLASKILDGRDAEAATPAEKQQAAQFLGKFPDNWAMRKYTARPIQNYALSFGRTIPVNKNRLGIIAALTYRNEQTAEQDDQYSSTVFDYKGTDYVFTTLLGGSLNLGYTFGKNKLTLKNTYNRRFTDKIYQYNGIDLQNSHVSISNYAGQTLINELFQTSLSGEHILNHGIKLDYNAAVSTLERDQPNSRIIYRRGPLAGSSLPHNYYEYNFDDYQLDMGSVFYSHLAEKRYAYQVNVMVPFKLLNLNQHFKMGYQGSYRKADYGADSYRIRNVPGADNDFSGLAYTDVYNNQNFSNQKLFFIPFIGAGESLKNGSATGYDGSQNLNAYYGMLDLKPVKNLRLIGGFRMEKNNQKVFTNTQGKAAGPNEVAPVIDSLIAVSKTDWLPSINAIYALTPKMNVRAAYYETVARPDLRELSYFSYFDFDVFRTISGSNLKPTQIKNYDLRYEFYPGSDEIISVSGFYKKFTSPIELSIVPTSAKPLLIYKNLASAEDLGFEIDFRKSLRFVSGTSDFFKNLYLSGSFTWVDASVDLGAGTVTDEQGRPVESKRDRPLYGQSPYIINGGINYTGKHFGFNAVYNRYGKRIVYATAYTSADEYENPRDLIDLQLSYKFLKQQRAELRFNISDLLNQTLLIYQNSYGPNAAYPERTASVNPYPGDGDVAYPAGQLDPKGTAYNAPYDVVTFRRKNGTNYTLNFIYRF